MYYEIFLTLYVWLVLVAGVLAFMALDLKEKNKKLEERLLDIEKIKKLNINKRTVLSAKSNFESQLQTGVYGLAIWIFIIFMFILLFTETSKNNRKYNEINEKIKKNREISIYLLSQVELIKECIKVEEK